MKTQKLSIFLIILVILVIGMACGDKKKDSNKAPTVTLTAVPNSGKAPLTVKFKANATDADGSIVSYEWDLDANGVYEGNTSFDTMITIYNFPKVYLPKVKVGDDKGAFTEATANVNVTSN